MINLSKLKKVVQKDGKIEAQCPACSAAGADSKGNHLVIFPDGAFGCVANPDDGEHSRLILKLVGDRSAPSMPKLVIHRENIPEISTILRIGRIGNRATPAKPGSEDQRDTATGPVSPPAIPASDTTITEEDTRRFLYGA